MSSRSILFVQLTQSPPLFDAERFRSAAGFDVSPLKQFFGLRGGYMQARRERIAKRLSLLRKSRFDQFEKGFQELWFDARSWENIYAQHSRINFGLGEERFRWDERGEARLAVDLHAQRQQAQVAGFGADALRDFLLNCQHDAARFDFAFEQMTDHRRSDVIWDIRNDDVILFFD